MKKQNRFLSIFTAITCLTTFLFAADGDFIGTDPYTVTIYNWSDSSNWRDGNVPDGAGDVAYITNAIFPGNTADAKGIALDSNPTVEKLFISLDKSEEDAVSVALALGTITLEGDDPEINVATAPNFLGAFLGVTSDGYGGVLAGTSGFKKTGNGTLFLDGDHTISGTLNLNEGSVWLNWPNSAQYLDVQVNSNAVLLAGKHTNNINSVTVNSGGDFEPLADPRQNPFYIFSPSIIIKSNGYFRIADLYGLDIRGSNITVQSGGSIFCPFSQSFVVYNDIKLEGRGHIGGAIEVLNASAYGVFNGPLVMTDDTRIFQHGETGSLTFNAPFSGDGSLVFIGQSDSYLNEKTYYLNAQNVHNGATSLQTLNCSTYYEIGTNDCFPTAHPLEFLIHNWSNSVLLQVNMNDFVQTVPSLNLACGEGEDTIMLNGNPGSKLSVLTNVTQSGGIAKIVGTQLEIAGNLAVNGSMLGMSNVLFLAGSSIGGSGTIDKITVPTGVTVAPGNSIGTTCASRVSFYT